MRIVRLSLVGSLCTAVSLAFAGPAAAATYYTPSTSSFAFSFGGNDNDNSAGNYINFSSNVVNGSQLTVKATAWNATKVSTTYSFTKAALEQWSGGLGVTSTVGDDPTKSGCGLGDCNSHEIDNLGNATNSSSIDFIRLDFSQAVVLGGIGQTVYPSLNAAQNAYQYDADYSIGRGIMNSANTAFTTATDVKTTLTGVTNLTTNLFTYNKAITSCTASNNNPCTQSQTIYSQTQAPYETASKTWYVAASVLANYGGDGKVDGFKLANLNAYYTTWTPHQSAVPEPSSWMTMIVGFGVAGSALRRTRRQKAATTAA